jgi:hypothetical protein
MDRRSPGSPDHEYPGIHPRRRAEGPAGDGPAESGDEHLPPTSCARRVRAGPPAGRRVLHDDMCAEETASRLQQPAQDRRRDGEGWIRDHVIGAPREAQVGGVGAYDDDRVTESVAQMRSPTRMSFDRDNPAAAFEEHRGERAGAGTDIDDE